MIAFDLPPPAIVQARPVVPFALHVNGEDAARLPDDLMAMPVALRALVKPSEVRPYLPDEYRRLSDAWLVGLLGNIGGLPGVIMAGGIKTAWLYTADGTFEVPGDWNKNDNRLHSVGRGGNGGQSEVLDAIESTAGGAGGGGAGYASKINAVLTPRSLHSLTIALTSGDTWFSATDYLLAKSGTNANFESGGAGGNKASCVGDVRSSGGNGISTSTGFRRNTSGGSGGGAGGPDGDGTNEASFIGGFPNGGIDADWDEKVPGVRSGHGGNAGFSDPTLGSPGDQYGGGGGGPGASWSPPQAFSGAPGFQGCILILNNVSI
jgi:hypothetical protein